LAFFSHMAYFAITITSIVCEFYRKLSTFIEEKYHKKTLLDFANKGILFWWDFERASSLICGNKIPTRCNRVFVLHILLSAQHVSGTSMPTIRNSRVLYRCSCLWYMVLWFSSCWSGVELTVMCPVCRILLHPANRTHNFHYNLLTWILINCTWDYYL